MSYSQTIMLTIFFCLLCVLITTNCDEVVDQTSKSDAIEISAPINISLKAHINTRKKWNSNIKMHNCNQDFPRNLIDIDHNVSDTGVSLTVFLNGFLNMEFSCTHDFDIITTKLPITKRDDYTHIPDLGYYKFHEGPATWNDAWKTCDDEEAYLAVINSKGEADMLVNFMNIKSRVLTDEFVHIGFHDLFSTGVYTTIKGERLSLSGYSEWLPGEPNSFGEERCGSVNRKGLFNDVTCSSTKSFICEKDYN